MPFYVVSKTIYVPQSVLFHGKKEYTTKSMNIWGHLYRSLQSTMFWRVMVSLKTSQGLLWKLGLISVQKYENVALCSWLRRKDKSYGDSTSLHPAAAGHWIGTEQPMLLNINLFSLYRTLLFSKHFYNNIPQHHSLREFAPASFSVCFKSWVCIFQTPGTSWSHALHARPAKLMWNCLFLLLKPLRSGLPEPEC